MKINDNLQFYLMYFVLLLSTCKRQIIMILFFTSSMLNTKSSSVTFSFILTVEYTCTSIHLLSEVYFFFLPFQKLFCASKEMKAEVQQGIIYLIVWFIWKT